MIREQMYAALGATNEAILRTTAQDDLFQRVCDAAVHGGGIHMAVAFLPESDGWLRMVARSGARPKDDLRISVDPSSSHGNGLCGMAFRTAQPAVANDFQNDPRLKPWLSEGRGTTLGAATAVPIVRDGKSIGVFMFFVEEAGSLTDDVVALLVRMMENVSFALGVFEHETERRRTERANRRLNDMFTALTATNTAIVRARTEQELYDSVCVSISTAGHTLGAAAVFLADPDSHWLKLVACHGEGVDGIRAMELSVDPDHPRGQGLAGPAFRNQQVTISYDLLTDDRSKQYADRTRSPYGGAAIPLTVGGRSAGILYCFFARTSGREEQSLIQLLQDIGENVSFALEGLQREERTERLARMFAALSQTNEAIMRASTREELYQFVCDAIAGAARFTSTTIALVDESCEFLKVRGVSGPNAHRMLKLTLATSADHPGGKGLSGMAYRTGRPAVSNSWMTDDRSRSFRNNESGTRSGCGLPLFSRGKIIGVMLFMSSEPNAFAPEFVEVLERLARNLSFALENFERNDEKLEAERRVQHLATHDALTGLPNRVMYAQLLEQTIANCRRSDTRCAVLFADLDRFKIVNDSLGHTAGDELLMETARRLRSAVRDNDVVARLGGDEFVVILNDLTKVEDVEAVARKLLAALHPPIQILGHDCRTTGSIGIAVYPEHGRDGQTLTRNADIAMYLAKEEGKNAYRLYSADIKSQSVERLMLETDLRRALELGQLSLHYQPKILAATGKVSGVEALLRWTHPEIGSIPPMKFIPLAEESGLIVPIGRWVLRAACEQAMEWQRQGLAPLPVAVNLSPRQFQDEHLLADIDDVLAKTDLAPSLLQLEITESMVMQNVDRAIRLLDAIQSRGIRLAIDDFGTGYSSMSIMKKFPIDTIKIDRSFVRDLERSQEDRAITTAIINMGKALGLTVVAEGVETTEQDQFLRSGSCDELQGYLFSRPVPPEEIPAIIAPSVASPSLQPDRAQTDSPVRLPRRSRTGS